MNDRNRGFGKPRRPRFDDERQPLTSENPAYAPKSGGKRGGGRPKRDDGAPRFDRRDDRGPRSDRRDDRGPRTDRRDDRGPRSDRRDDRGPRPERRDDRGPRTDRRNERGPRPGGNRYGNDSRPQRDDRSPRERYHDGDERQPLTNESPSLRGRSGRPPARGGRGGAPSGGRRSGPSSSGGRGMGGGRRREGFSSPTGSGPARKRDTDERRSKAYASDIYVFKENLDENKPQERKMRSRRKKSSSDGETSE